MGWWSSVLRHSDSRNTIVEISNPLFGTDAASPTSTSPSSASTPVATAATQGAAAADSGSQRAAGRSAAAAPLHASPTSSSRAVHATTATPQQQHSNASAPKSGPRSPAGLHAGELGAGTPAVGSLAQQHTTSSRSSAGVSTKGSNSGMLRGHAPARLLLPLSDEPPEATAAADADAAGGDNDDDDSCCCTPGAVGSAQPTEFLHVPAGASIRPKSGTHLHTAAAAAAGGGGTGGITPKPAHRLACSTPTGAGHQQQAFHPPASAAAAAATPTGNRQQQQQHHHPQQQRQKQQHGRGTAAAADFADGDDEADSLLADMCASFGSLQVAAQLARTESGLKTYNLSAAVAGVRASQDASMRQSSSSNSNRPASATGAAAAGTGTAVTFAHTNSSRDGGIVLAARITSTSSGGGGSDSQNGKNNSSSSSSSSTGGGRQLERGRSRLHTSTSNAHVLCEESAGDDSDDDAGGNEECLTGLGVSEIDRVSSWQQMSVSGGSSRSSNRSTSADLVLQKVGGQSIPLQTDGMKTVTFNRNSSSRLSTGSNGSGGGSSSRESSVHNGSQGSSSRGSLDATGSAAPQPHLKSVTVASGAPAAHGRSNNSNTGVLQQGLKLPEQLQQAADTTVAEEQQRQRAMQQQQQQRVQERRQHKQELVVGTCSNCLSPHTPHTPHSRTSGQSLSTESSSQGSSSRPVSGNMFRQGIAPLTQPLQLPPAAAAGAQQPAINQGALGSEGSQWATPVAPAARAGGLKGSPQQLASLGDAWAAANTAAPSGSVPRAASAAGGMLLQGSGGSMTLAVQAGGTRATASVAGGSTLLHTPQPPPSASSHSKAMSMGGQVGGVPSPRAKSAAAAAAASATAIAGSSSRAVFAANQQRFS